MAMDCGWYCGSRCAHGCPGCHNPVTWDINGGLPFDEAADKELEEQLAKDYISGITTVEAILFMRQTGGSDSAGETTQGKIS